MDIPNVPLYCQLTVKSNEIHRLWRVCPINYLPSRIERYIFLEFIISAASHHKELMLMLMLMFIYLFTYLFIYFLFFINFFSLGSIRFYILYFLSHANFYFNSKNK